MQITAPQGTSDSAWLALRAALWPDASEAEQLSGMADAIASAHYVRLAMAANGSAVGLVEASKRNDYVNGTSTSPVGFLEGLYVVPAAHTVHRALGFEETERVVYFRRALRDA